MIQRRSKEKSRRCTLIQLQRSFPTRPSNYETHLLGRSFNNRRRMHFLKLQHCHRVTFNDIFI